jgi:hypothetical protein
MIWKIWKKGKSNSEKIWKIRTKSMYYWHDMENMKEKQGE